MAASAISSIRKLDLQVSYVSLLIFGKKRSALIVRTHRFWDDSSLYDRIFCEIEKHSHLQPETLTVTLNFWWSYVTSVRAERDRQRNFYQGHLENSQALCDFIANLVMNRWGNVSLKTVQIELVTFKDMRWHRRIWNRI